jgi:hypothetical protein
MLNEEFALTSPSLSPSLKAEGSRRKAELKPGCVAAHPFQSAAKQLAFTEPE